MDASLLMGVLIQIIVIGAVCGILWWLLGYLGLPEPFAKVGRGVIAVVAAFFLINLLLGLSGSPIVKWR